MAGWRGAIVIAATILAACTPTRSRVATLGGTPNDASPPVRAADAAVEWAECMRDHGVEVQDPEESGSLFFLSEENVGDPDLEQAQDACRHLLPPNFGPPPMSPQERARRFDQAVRYTTCMREQGIDLPDPTPDQPIGLAPGVDPDAPDFIAAERICGHFLRA